MSTISEFRQEPEDPLDRWRREQAEREEPRPRERRLDTAQPTLDDIDRRIEERVAAEHEFMMGILTELLAQIQSDAEMRGPSGPAGPRGEQGPPGKLPLVKLWTPETVYYEGDVVAFDGGTFQARRDTGQPPSHADWICLATAGRDGNSMPCVARSTRAQTIVVSTSLLSTAAASSRSRISLVPAPVPAGSSLPARASVGLQSAALPARRAMRERAALPFAIGRSIARATSRRPS
jgi:hypothetical protein